MIVMSEIMMGALDVGGFFKKGITSGFPVFSLLHAFVSNAK